MSSSENVRVISAGFQQGLSLPKTTARCNDDRPGRFCDLNGGQPDATDRRRDQHRIILFEIAHFLFPERRRLQWPSAPACMMMHHYDSRKVRHG